MQPVSDIILAAAIGTAIVMTVATLSIRIGFKPMFESWLRLRQGTALEDAKILQDRRITLLETELQAMQDTMQKLVESEEFRRQLEASQRGLEALPNGEQTRGRARGA